MKTLILGATTNTQRYAYMAAEKLTAYGHEIIPVGIKKGEVFGQQIINDKTLQENVDTITMYVGKKHQTEWYDYILKSPAKRIIFNPGTENNELMTLAQQAGKEVVEGCTLVMLSVGSY